MSSARLALKVHDPAAATGFPLADLMERYATAHPLLKPNSRQQLQNVLNSAIAWGAVTCDDIFSLDSFERWQAWIAKTPKRRGAGPGQLRSPRTIKGRRDSLWTLWKFAKRRGLCDEPPPDWEDLAPIECPREDPVAWDVDEMKQIIAQCRQARTIGAWGPDHWQSLVETIWYTAERIGDGNKGLLSCRPDDLRGNVLYLPASRTKDKKPGVHRLPAELCDLIRRGATPEALWPWPFGIGALRENYRKGVLKALGLPTSSKHLFHCLRRSSITEVENVAGREAAQAHGRHSTSSMTERYVSKRLSRGHSAAQQLPSIR